MATGNKIFGFRSGSTKGLEVCWALWIVVCLLCVFANFASAQSSDRTSGRSSTTIPQIRAESELVLVRVMVEDKKIWRNGPSEAGERCALAAKETLARLPATEPYIPNDCEGLFIRGLTAKDFHVLVDGTEQRIQTVTTASEGLRVRDNQGLHNDFSQDPVGKWSTSVGHIPHYIIEGDYGLLARNRYEISFTPDRSNAAGCHQIKVKVDHRNSIVNARDEFCASESPYDTLNGGTFGGQLEHSLTSGERGTIALSLQTAVYRAADRRGRVRIALEFPGDVLRRQWRQNWTLDATIGILGMVYRQDRTLASRFSDLACCTPYLTAFEFGLRGTSLAEVARSDEEFGAPPGVLSNELRRLEKGTLPTRYETHLDLPPGEYDLRIILGDGEKFGRAEAHLNIENYDGNGLALSSVMLCKRFRDAHVAAVEASAANFAPQYVPMVSKDIQVSPAGNTEFKSGEPLIPYFEIYAPHTPGEPPAQIQAHLRIVDAKNGTVVKDFPVVDVGPYIQPGSTTIPIAREVPIATLPEGQYRLEVQASDSASRTTPWRGSNFTIVAKELEPLQKVAQ